MDNNFMRAEDVAEVLGVSKSFAYKVMKKLNAELKAQDYVTIAGRVKKNILWKSCATAERTVNKWQFTKKIKALGE